MNRIAILYICIGKYITFWKDFYESFEKHFLKNTSKDYFVFTDNDELLNENKYNNVHCIYQQDLGWPNNTLHRFKMFLKIKQQLQEYDYIFFLNANYICLKDITEEEFLPENNQLLVTLHPWYCKYKNPIFLPFDRNKLSTAFISYYNSKAKKYYCGGLNGGGSKEFIQMMETIDRNIDIDANNNVLALWHDESHLNRYMLDQIDFKVLPPDYAYPEQFILPFDKKMLLKDKSKYFNANKKIDKTSYKTKYQLVHYPILNLKWLNEKIKKIKNNIKRWT